MSCPCKGCEYRYVGCHAECEIYKAWQQERLATRKLKSHYLADQFLYDQRQKIKQIVNIKK